ncbi:MAG: hypothetical protein ACF8PN_03970 [Phycisphaerales bacterium]
MIRSNLSNRALMCVAGATIAGTAFAAVPKYNITLTQNFENLSPSNPLGGWQFQAHQVLQDIVQQGRNHYLYAVADATSFSLVSQGNGANAWAGDKDFRASGVRRISFMTAVRARQIPTMRMMTVSLWNDSGTPEDDTDDFGFYYDATDSMLAFDGSVNHFSFEIPSQVTHQNPFGWIPVRGPEAPLFPPEHVWDAVITDVDRIEFNYFDPQQKWFFIQLYDLGADNIELEIDTRLRPASPDSDRLIKISDAVTDVPLDPEFALRRRELKQVNAAQQASELLVQQLEELKVLSHTDPRGSAGSKKLEQVARAAGELNNQILRSLQFADPERACTRRSTDCLGQALSDVDGVFIAVTKLEALEQEGRGINSAGVGQAIALAQDAAINLDRARRSLGISDSDGRTVIGDPITRYDDTDDEPFVKERAYKRPAWSNGDGMTFSVAGADYAVSDTDYAIDDTDDAIDDADRDHGSSDTPERAYRLPVRHRGDGVTMSLGLSSGSDVDGQNNSPDRSIAVARDDGTTRAIDPTDDAGGVADDTDDDLGRDPRTGGMGGGG